MTTPDGAVTGISIMDPVSGSTSIIMPRDGVIATSLDVAPAVRAVEEDRAFADGALDTTGYLSSAAVTLSLLLVPPGMYGLADELNAYFRPSLRPQLIVTSDTWDSPRLLTLRFDSKSAAISDPTNWEWQVQFKAPRGYWEDTAQQVFSIVADFPDTAGLAVTATNGVAITAANGLDMPPSLSAGSSVIEVNGNATPTWVARLYGPAVGPKLSRDDTGQIFSFTAAYTLPAGSYIELNSDTLTAYENSDPDASRLNLVDWGASEWFQLDPGDLNRLRYHATSGTTAGSQCQLVVFPVWMI